MRIFVLGYLGVKSIEEAKKIASELNSEAQNFSGNGKYFHKNIEISADEMKSIKENPIEVLDMPSEIERLDGRSLLKICMGHGEHALRNNEYEVLSKLLDPNFEIGMAKNEIYPENLVVACGDGIVLDDQCYEMLQSEKRVVIELPLEEMWANAKDDKSIPYAYMQFGSDEERFAQFKKNYELRTKLYQGLR